MNTKYKRTKVDDIDFGPFLLYQIFVLLTSYLLLQLPISQNVHFVSLHPLYQIFVLPTS